MRTNEKFEKLHNMRDLGGIPAEGGKVVKRGLFLRSAKLNELTDSDKDRLFNDFNLRLIADLRTEKEASAFPDLSIDGVKYVHCPLVEKTTTGLSVSSEHSIIKNIATVDTEAEKLALVPHMERNYRNLIALEYSRGMVKEFIRMVVENEEGAVLFHCSSGKDRTGMMAALILSMLGASKEDIYDDYMTSLTSSKVQRDAQAQYDKFMDACGFESVADAVKDLCLVKPRYLDAFFDEIDRSCGGMNAFIRDFLGIDEKSLEYFKNRCLE